MNESTIIYKYLILLGGIYLLKNVTETIRVFLHLVLQITKEDLTLMDTTVHFSMILLGIIK